MSVQKERRVGMAEVQRDEYVQVGSDCELFVHKVGIEELSELRAAVVDEYFMQMPKVSRSYTEEGTKVACAKSFHETFANTYEEFPSFFGAAILRSMAFEDPEVESWRLVIGQNRMQRSRHNNAPQRSVTRLKVEVFNNQVVEAIKQVHIVRGVGELTAEAIETQLTEDSEDGSVVLQRRAYERYVTADDCHAAVDFLSRIVRRTQAS